MPESAQLFLDSLKTAANVTELVGKPEDLYFEAKTCSDPFSKPDQEHLAEALSGFANADGGVLIYGLVAQGGARDMPDAVTRVEQVKKLDLLTSRILGLLGFLVEPPVPNVQVLPREFDRLPNEGFVLVYVPPSDLGPHRSRKSREYYRRHGTGFFRMEHFEIAEMFGRRRKPVLKLFWKPPSRPRCVFKARTKLMETTFLIGLQNAGRGLAKYPAVWIDGARPCDFGIDGNGSMGLPARPTSHGHLFGGGADHVIYPGANLEVTTFLNQFKADSPQVPWPDVKLTYELYADEMPPVQGEIVVVGATLQNEWGSQSVVTWPGD
jgi:hypothetical protein